MRHTSLADSCLGAPWASAVLCLPAQPHAALLQCDDDLLQVVQAEVDVLGLLQGGAVHTCGHVQSQSTDTRGTQLQPAAKTVGAFLKIDGTSCLSEQLSLPEPLPAHCCLMSCLPACHATCGSCAPVLATLSDPAKSTRWSLECLTTSLPACRASRLMVKMQWLREEA